MKRAGAVLSFIFRVDYSWSACDHSCLPATRLPMWSAPPLLCWSPSATNCRDAFPCSTCWRAARSGWAFLLVKQSIYYNIPGKSVSQAISYTSISYLYSRDSNPSPSCMPEAVLVRDLLRCPAPHFYRSRWPSVGRVLLLSSFCYAGKSGIEASRFFDIDYRQYSPKPQNPKK